MVVESFNMREAFPFDSLLSDVDIVGLSSILPNTKEDAGGGSACRYLLAGLKKF